MIDRLVQVWLLLWRLPTNVWRYVTGRNHWAFARAMLIFTFAAWVVYVARTGWDGTPLWLFWRTLDVLLVLVIAWLTRSRYLDLQRREQAVKRRDDGTVYSYINPRALGWASVWATADVFLFSVSRSGGWLLWVLWFSTEFIAAQDDGSGKTLRQTARNLVARIKAIRLPSWRPAPVPRPFPA